MVDAYSESIAKKYPHGHVFASVIGDVVGTSDVMDNLSPPCRGIARVLGQSLEQGLGTSIDAAKIDVLPTSIMNSLANLAVGVVSEVLVAVKALLAGTEAVDAIGAVADMIPFVSGIISLVLSSEPGGSNAAKGVGPASSDPSQRAAFCQASFAPITGSGGADSPFVACDMFTNTSQDSLGVRRISTIGYLLQDILEEPFPLSPDKVLALGIPGKSYFKASGIPAPIRSLFKRMRLAMVSGCGDRGWDGGNSLLPLYIDLLRIQVALGRINYDWLWWQAKNHFDWIHPEVRIHGETCLSYDKRPWRILQSILETWDNTLVPKHDPGNVKTQAVAASENQIVEQANQSLVMSSVSEFGRSFRPLVRLRPAHEVRRVKLARKTTNARHAAISAGAIGAAAFGLWRSLG